MRYEITILGVVQGVGYRPFVAALAEQLHIKGSVRNSGGVVRIDAFGDAEAMDNFICRLRSYAPPAARVDRVQAKRAEKEGSCPSDFRIVESEAENHADLPLLPPDLPVCEECLAEMKKPGDSRYRYPFISCVNCGPRYSIMEAVPYDRAHITMREFAMCPSCRKEYAQMGNRRRHAQTISCHDCGPQLCWKAWGDEGAVVYREKEEALEEALSVCKEAGL